MGNYAFEGQVIKLNKADYETWSDLYRYLDLNEELIQMDTEYTMEAREAEIEGDAKKAKKIRKEWFVKTYKRLYTRNKKSKPYSNHSYRSQGVNQIRSTRDISLEDEISDTSWAK